MLLHSIFINMTILCVILFYFAIMKMKVCCIQFNSLSNIILLLLSNAKIDINFGPVNLKLFIFNFTHHAHVAFGAMYKVA